MKKLISILIILLMAFAIIAQEEKHQSRPGLIVIYKFRRIIHS